VRIIRGKYKTRKLPVAKNVKARPTTDFAKENLFNVLENWYDFENLKVLDLFAGTGSISYEFASRGCREVYAVESDSYHFANILKTAETIGIKEIIPIKMDVFRFLRQCHEKFDIIFADPPYAKNISLPVLEFVNNSSLLTQNGLLIVEEKHTVELPSSLATLELIDRRVYGETAFCFYRSSAAA